MGKLAPKSYQSFHHSHTQCVLATTLSSPLVGNTCMVPQPIISILVNKTKLSALMLH